LLWLPVWAICIGCFVNSLIVYFGSFVFSFRHARGMHSVAWAMCLFRVGCCLKSH
jgi:hypothetical protein